ncbi:carbamoyltransferase HypF [Deinococcus xinjiangensis]|uniref:Carbamoyltransferase n=1 Tax=Deinococcus xinjiangensis TaxID=457454 RepID=A0ABP9V9A3_9DEIO
MEKSCRWASAGAGASLPTLNNTAHLICIRGVVQGVGFRPFVYRLALRHGLRGWVRNDPSGVTVHLEGESLGTFLHDLRAELPPAAVLEDVQVREIPAEGFPDFQIIHSEAGGAIVTRISPDLAPCPDCLREMRDPNDRRYRYPYINCTNCGPRLSIILGLPYDRPQTTMKGWPLCEDCQREYDDPLNRRYHAQPVACPTCGPSFTLSTCGGGGACDQLNFDSSPENLRGFPALQQAAQLLQAGQILAVKGVGGYHLMCDALREDAVHALRERKFRKDKPFALLARDLETARSVIHLTAQDEEILTGTARSILLAPAKIELPEVAPLFGQLGVMLPSSPLQELLFDAGAPPLLVATSGNRSSEPMVMDDAEALESLAALADAFLIGERPIARRVDDSVVMSGGGVVRRARGLAPAVTAKIPSDTPILAVGADLKNAVTLVVGGQAFTGAYIGDLDHLACREAHQEAVQDLLGMYGLTSNDCVVAHDLHPQYVSTGLALELPALKHVAVQHHHAHLASVLAEHDLWHEPALGLILDGTGYGPDGTIWGGEFLLGSLSSGFERVGHFYPAPLVGGDAAARLPAQAAVGYLAAAGLPVPDSFPLQARRAAGLARSAIQTTSAGRLFDAVAALLGFSGPQTYEGQAAMWLESLARQASGTEALPFIWDGQTLDWRPALAALATADIQQAALAFHVGLADALAQAARELCEQNKITTIGLSGGVWQNSLLLNLVGQRLGQEFRVLLPRHVPANDGGLSLGQAAVAASRQFG